MDKLKSELRKSIKTDDVRTLVHMMSELEITEEFCTWLMVECLFFKSWKCLNFLLKNYNFDLDPDIFMNYMNHDFNAGDPYLLKWITYIVTHHYICCLVED